MFKLKYNWIMILLLLMTPLMVLSVNSWFSVWMNMELNLIMFIGFIVLNNYNIYDSPMKYYLINSFSSSLFILMISLNMFILNNLILLIMNLMMIIKLGFVPFHLWFIDLMINLNWVSCFILSTWQKLIPFFILMYIYLMNFLMMIIMISGLFSVIFGINQINLKKIFGYSSINHMCWMLFLMFISELMWILYFMIYMMINLSLMILNNLYMLNNLLDFYKFINSSIFFVYLLIMLSLSGLPPFFGFMMKWLSMYKMIIEFNVLFVLILVIYSLMYLYNYIRLVYFMMLMNYLMIKVNYLIISKILNYLNYNNLNLIFLFSLTNLFMIMFWLIY